MATAYAPIDPENDAEATFGNLYARSALDCVVEAAAAIAQDFVRRPNEYRDAAAIGPTLRQFRYSLGKHEEWPNASEREALYVPLFGGIGGRAAAQHPFYRFGQSVRDTAIKRADRVSPAGDEILRARFVDAANDFLSFLRTLQGAVVKDANLTTKNEFSAAVAVLRDTDVAKAFSLKPASTNIWPPLGAADGDAGALIEKITRQLQLPIVTQQQFAVLHRIALHGSRTIDGVLNGDHGDPDSKVVDALARDAASWESALSGLGK